MKAPVNIHPPKNWQDFETLCLKIWGEIWNIPHEIEFNSDNAQGQNGVDIYGPIDGGLSYNGIQCKNKKLNLIDGKSNRISVGDIQAEIEKAKLFQPSLSKLVIATSLPKDQKVEEYVRIQSVENIKNGLFSIQICFWEFFERKIFEFPNVYNWYIKNEDFHRVKELTVTFDNGKSEIICHPKFQKNVRRYIFNPKDENTEDELDYSLSLAEAIKKYDSLDSKPNKKFNDLFSKISLNQSLIGYQKYVWGQTCWLKLQIHNSGESVIEDFKIELDFEGDFEKVGAATGHFLIKSTYVNNVKEYSNTKRSLYIETKNKTLVQDDYFNTGSFFIIPRVCGENSEVIINWKLLSRDFTDSGILSIKIEPKFHTVFIEENVDTIQEEREDISYKLFERPGISNITGINYLDKESDYNFE